jgi:GTP-dependent phosphoenolpyruvate carboxykinase
MDWKTSGGFFSGPVTLRRTKDMSAPYGNPKVTNEAVLSWVEKMAELCGPERLFWCDGSPAEREHLTQLAVEEKILLPLSPDATIIARR